MGGLQAWICSKIRHNKQTKPKCEMSDHDNITKQYLFSVFRCSSISGICPCSKVGQWVGCKLEFVPKLDTTNKQSPNVKCPTMTILQNNICFLYLSLLYCIVNSFLDAVASLASVLDEWILLQCNKVVILMSLMCNMSQWAQTIF